jgi:hypothetical protein
MVAIWLRGLVRRRQIANSKLLTGNTGSLCEQQPQPLKALRAPGGPVSQYKTLYFDGVAV